MVIVLATVTIRTVSVQEETLNLEVEFDFSVVSGGSMYMHSLALSKPKYLYGKNLTRRAPLTIT